MRIFWITVLLVSVVPFATQSKTVAPQYHGVYIDRFDKLLADTAESREFLKWAVRNDIQHFSCYDLYTILSNKELTARLTGFMELATRNYHIVTFDAVAASAVFFIEKVYPFNLQYASRGIGFQGFNLEREWWTSDVTFASHRDNMQQLQKFIRDLSAIRNLSLETYIGWFGLVQTSKETEAMALVQYADVISVSAYQKHLRFSYLKSRLEELAKAAEQTHKKQPVILMFSMEPAFSGKYSRKHSYQEMYDKLMAEYAHALARGEIDARVAKYLEIKGWKVFAQSYARRYRP
jgi:hypothetical protein